MSDREAFEERAKSRLDITRYLDGYTTESANQAWWAWQAAIVAQGEREPVAWMQQGVGMGWRAPSRKQIAAGAIPLYAAPPSIAAEKVAPAVPTPSDKLIAVGQNMASCMSNLSQFGSTLMKEQRAYFGSLSDLWDSAMSARKASIPELRAALAVPDGWQIVPIEPTQEMRTAGYSSNAIESWPDGQFHHHGANDAYKAMLNAAPTPPKPPK